MKTIVSCPSIAFLFSFALAATAGTSQSVALQVGRVYEAEVCLTPVEVVADLQRHGLRRAGGRRGDVDQEMPNVGKGERERRRQLIRVWVLQDGDCGYAPKARQRGSLASSQAMMVASSLYLTPV